MSELVIVGGGGFAKMLLEWIRGTGGPFATGVKGFLDEDPSSISPDYSLPCLGNPLEYIPTADERYLCAIQDPEEKLRACHSLRQRGAVFTTFVHPCSFVGPSVKLSEGCIVAPMAGVTTDATLGEFVTIQMFAGVGHDAVIGAGSTIGSHCDITGCVRIGEKVLIEPHAVLLPKVIVGDGARIGAGSVVVRNVAAGTAVFGVPAKRVKDPAHFLQV